MQNEELSEKVAELTMTLDRIERHGLYERHRAEIRHNATVISTLGALVVAFLLGWAM